MPHYTEYKCGDPELGGCGKRTLRELLTVKKVLFSEIGAGAKVLKSRTKVWLCPECLEKDPDYNAEPYKAPGMVSAPLERVREIGAQQQTRKAA